MPAQRHRQDRLTVAFIGKHGVCRYASLPPLPPLPHRDHRGQKVEALCRQPIFNFAPVIWARRAVKNPAFGQPRQPVGKDITRNANLGQEFFENDWERVISNSFILYSPDGGLPVLNGR